MTKIWRIAALVIVAATVLVSPAATVGASPPPTTPPSPVVTNDLLPENNNVTNCIGTAEPGNCGSKARADGHTYLVFLALVLGLGFIGWRITRGVKARDAAHKPTA